MVILVLNCGSSSIKYQVIDMEQTGSTLRKMGDEMVNSIIETAETLDENSEAYKLGQELKNKLNKGKKLTDTEIGRLFAETTRMLDGTDCRTNRNRSGTDERRGAADGGRDRRNSTADS